MKEKAARKEMKLQGKTKAMRKIIKRKIIWIFEGRGNY